MTIQFVHEVQSQRVRFGSGTTAATLARELERLGAARVMVIATKSGHADCSSLWSVRRPVDMALSIWRWKEMPVLVVDDEATAP